MASDQSHNHDGDGNHNHTDQDHGDHHKQMVADFRRRFWISLILTIPVLALAPMLQEFAGLRETLAFPGDGYVSLGLSTVIFFYGGWPFLKGIYDELSGFEPGMMTLIAVAITTAYVYSAAVVLGLEGEVFFWELATLIDIMLVGHWIEMRSVMGASRALEKLAELMPTEAHRLAEDGETEDVAVDELVNGDRILIKPGEKVPADGRIVDGHSSLNEAMLTGESKPVEKSEGDEVIGGSINGEGALEVEVERTGDDSYLSQVITLVREAQASKSKTQDLANRAAVWLTGVALTAGALTLTGWLMFSGQTFAYAIERMVTVMVITCPHALGLAVPLVVAVSTSLGAKNGLLIRNRPAFERARNIDAILFDKTGTLTKGEFGVTETFVFEEAADEMTEDELLKLAASLEQHSEHPIAQGIVRSVDEDYPVEDFQSITGKGVEGTVQGQDIKAVSPGYLRENDYSYDDARVDEALESGKTVVYVILEGELIGAIALADIIRPESKEAIARFKKMGITCMMITGDNAQVAEAVADEIGLDEFFAEVLPEEKAAKVKEVQNRGMTVAMTGDGVNDAPALAQADVGIAVGAGTDVAVETADIVLVSNKPTDVAHLIALARNTYKKMVQNLFWATGYNAFAIPLAAGALYAWGIVLSPAVGAILMSASTVIVAINARMLTLE
jgi:Cu2+-exporting ATPase